MPVATGRSLRVKPVHRLDAALATMAALMAMSVLLRTGIFDGVGEYSDIVHLYRRDGLAGHPLPYFDYRLEYPVLIGAFQWLAGFAGGTDELYFVVSAAVLGALALTTVWQLAQLPGTNPWLLAAAPAVVFWGVQNWDFLGLAPLVAALVLHERGRDGWGAAALALAVSTKLFPLVVLPVVLTVRLAQRRRRQAGVVVAVFALVTVAVNAPVAIDLGGTKEVSLRDSWAYFFELSRDRPAENTLWTPDFDAVMEVNRASGLLLALGLGLLLALTYRCIRLGREALLPAAAAALLWLFATSKLYSAQYALWIMLALALAAVPMNAAAIFVATDVIFFITLWGGLAWLGELPGAARQLVTAGLALYVAFRLSRASGAAAATDAAARPMSSQT